MLLNMIYSYGSKDTGWTDTLDVVYRDLHTGEKKLKTIEKPKVEIYFTKDEYRDYDYNKTDLELDKLNRVECAYKNIPWAIAKDAGPEYENALKQMIETGNRKDMNRVQQYRYVFGSDMDCESYYRVYWLQHYDNDDIKRVTKAYADIEVDLIDIVGFPDPDKAECPVNVITLVNEDNRNVYTLILNNPKNPLIAEFVNDIDSFIDDLHESFDDVYGEFTYNMYMYDEETDLLCAFFSMLNTLKPDFLLWWNGFGFDTPYLINRLKRLGLNPFDIMTHHDFKNKVCKFVKDTVNFDIKNKGDRFELSSYTKWIDQMRLYGATRKGRGELTSINLNHIGKAEINDSKIDYTEEANIKTLPYVNFKLFIKYNIKDTLLQYGIENKVQDIDNLYLRSYSNCTNYDKIFKQLFMLKRRAYYEYMLQGTVIGNNINVFNTDDAESFTGALVGDPLLNDYTGLILFGKASMFVYADVIDMDFSAMYPHITVAFNIERNTMVGKLIIPGFETEPYDHIFVNEGIYDNSDTETDDDDDDLDKEPEFLKKYDAGRDFVETYLTGDINVMGSRWFNLPSYDVLHERFKESHELKPRKKNPLHTVVSGIINKIKAGFDI